MSESTNSVVDVAQHLTLLEERRSALQRIIKITQSLESLRQGLQTVSNLRDSSQGFPEDALKTFEALGRKVRNLSDAEVKLRLDHLDQKVKTKLTLVLRLADELDFEREQAVDGARLDVVNQLVDEFKKHAQTAIALRVLLENRGVVAPALALSIPQKSIKAQLEQISSRESQYRTEVVRQVDSLRTDVTQILQSPSCTPAFQAVLSAMLAALQANLDHLNAGHPISTLPIPIADIAIDATPFSGLSYSTIPPSEQAVPSAEKLPAAAPKVDAKPIAKDPPKVEVKSPPVAPPKPDTRSFWGKFMDWLNTPWHVRWKDIDKDNKK